MAYLDRRTAKRVLRHRRSRAYFKEGTWTRDINQATEFPSAREVAETCLRHHLSNVDLILSSEAGLREITVRFS